MKEDGFHSKAFHGMDDMQRDVEDDIFRKYAKEKIERRVLAVLFYYVL